MAYEEDFYDGQKVTVSKIITNLDRSIVPMEYFEIYAANHEIDMMDFNKAFHAYDNLEGANCLLDFTKETDL